MGKIGAEVAMLGALALTGCGQVPDHESGSARIACYTCHGDRYLATTNPNHVVNGYPKTCEGCHATTGWTPATYSDHTSWPLTGAHMTTACVSCHVGGVYSGTPRECIGCHRSDYDATTDPPHATTGFPTSCESCHGTDAWQPATFRHDDFWPLAGKHQGAACEACHPGGVYAGTRRDCVGCHQPDYAGASNPPHAELGLPTTCETCHTPAGWETETFPGHDSLFRITSGHHSRFDCASCHLTEAWASFTCTGCHTGEHTLARMNEKHKDETDYQPTLNAYGVDGGCYHCHARAH